MNRSIDIYSKFLREKYTVKGLHQLFKNYGIKTKKRKKQDLIDELTAFFQNHDESIKKIQAAYKGYLVRKAMRCRGDALYNKSICTNDTDFYTLDNLNDVSPYDFITFYDFNDGRTYGFNIISLYKLLLQTEKQKTFKNPYTRNETKRNVIVLIVNSYLKSSKLARFPAPILEEEMNGMTKAQQIRSRITNVFKKIDDLGHYSHEEWFLDLHSTSLLIRFMRELSDIWNYRAQLKPEIKNRICGGTDPFNQYKYLNLMSPSYSVDILKELALTIMEKLIYYSTDSESAYLGSSYILTALTLVNDQAALAMPWLYNSVA